jgi:hypothetical protein
VKSEQFLILSVGKKLTKKIKFSNSLLHINLVTFTVSISQVVEVGVYQYDTAQKCVKTFYHKVPSSKPAAQRQ